MDQEDALFVVVGGSSSLGSRICGDLSDRGRSILATYSTSPDSIPASIPGVHCDTTCPSDCENLAERAFAMSSRVAVIYLPGISASAACHRQSLEDWKRVLEVNLTGAFLVAGAFIRRMRGVKFGRIIFAGSVTGRLGAAGTCSYSASKEGLRGLTRVLATENAALGITVNCLEIGYMDAGLSYTIPEEIRERIRRSIPAGGFGNPSEITESILFLERVSYVTGSVISLSGGL
jgi:NAD(P)-dependent dehydrogenase (short-subunit alcohol dehydrogenase family)